MDFGNRNFFYKYITDNSYDQNGDIIGVSTLLEPAEGTDVIPAIDPGTEISTGEGGGGKSWTIRTVAVEAGSPAEQGLDKDREIRADLEQNISHLQRSHTD